MLRTPTQPPEPERSTPVDITLFPLLNGIRPYEVRFTYDPAVPWQVTLHCKNPTEWIDWVLSRDVLLTGMSTIAGEGDVGVLPTDAQVWLLMDTPDGWAALCFKRADLAYALDVTEELVPRGSEAAFFDFDAALTKLGDPQ